MKIKLTDETRKKLKGTFKILKTIFGWLVALAIILTLIVILSRYKRYHTYKIDYKTQAVLEYYYFKDLLVTEVQDYIDEHSENSNLTALAVVDACEKYSVSITFVLAQAQLESSFGTKGLAKSTNSVWNHGAFDGSKFDQLLGWCKYSHPDLSIGPYLSNLTTNYLCNKCEEDLLENFTNKNGQRYASSESYERNLRTIYGKIKSTTSIDSLYQCMNYWSIRSDNQ